MLLRFIINIINSMFIANCVVRCLGYKHGTDCQRIVRTHRHELFWEKYQLCSKCSKQKCTEEYRNSIDGSTKREI